MSTAVGEDAILDSFANHLKAMGTERHSAAIHAAQSVDYASPDTHTERPIRMSRTIDPSPAAIDIDELIRLRLDAQVLGPMISRSQFDRAAEHFKEVLDRLEGFPETDRQRLYAALDDEDKRRELAIAINGLMHGKPAIKQRFDHYLATLQRLDLASWPLLTVWLALRHPGRFQPIDTADAEAAGWTLNWEGFCQSQRTVGPGRGELT